jgi:hypothetical protein
MDTDLCWSARGLLGLLLIGANLAWAEEGSINPPISVPLTALESTEVPEQSQLVTRVRGQLLERGTRARIPNANIFVLPQKLKATTDSEGRFLFEGFPVDQPFSWVVNVAGYKKLESPDRVSTNAERTLYIERDSYLVYETTIYDQADKRDDRTRSTKAKELVQLPGSFGDPIKAIQNLPGVNRPLGISSQVAIEGSAPGDTRYLLNGHEIPLIFHFGGFTSVVFPEVLDSVDFLAAGYGPEYSRALGGQIGASIRSPRQDRTYGLAFVDLFQAGALLEGKLGDNGGFFLGARQSYIGQVLKAAASASSNESDFDLTLAPSYADQIAVFENSPTPRHFFRLTALRSSDTLQFLLDSPVGRPASGRGTFFNERTFYRLLPEFRYRFSDTLKWQSSFALGNDFIRLDIYNDYLDIRQTVLTSRGELEWNVTEPFSTYIGFDHRYTWADVGFRFPNAAFGSASSTSAPLQANETLQSSEIGLYWRNRWSPPGTAWTIFPNLRLDYFTVTREVILEPRFALRYNLMPGLSLRGAVGNYAQTPQAQELSSTFGNQSLLAPRAWHYTAGFEKDFRGGRSQGLLWICDFWYRDFDKLIAPSQDFVQRNGSLVAERYNNREEGQAFGLSTSLRLTGRPWTAQVSYTLSESRRNRPEEGDFRFQFDQTHILNAIVSVELGGNWSLSSRLRFTTGNAFTPIVGALFDSDDDIFRPIQGARNSDRFSGFFSWDVRVDKKWVFDTWILSLYLDVQNLSNRKNTETLNYSFDYTQSEEVSFIPILPTLGLKGEF